MRGGVAGNVGDTDVVTFARKIQLIQPQIPGKSVSGIFISPEASEEVKQCGI
ncbi:hypothetical protein [Candidatus Parabeggiatoa sp. HSG14]|uniref:hypothetical protein n=1 Tax=Candidatus Parabeggiatoa sp. HSG14 TaxID=3055593 RepID=UPI0025A823C8|nr:hypothetical protein [Thiotrichales bacterium HSG14]